MNYENDVRIDQNSLDVEWLDQPTLMLQYGREKSNADRDVEFCKHQLELIKAELDKDIRKNPSDYEIEKVTETVVANLIIQQDEYQEALNEYLTAKHQADLLQIAVRAIDAKKVALENLVRLHGQQYFSSPSMPRDINTEWEKREKQRMSDKSVKITRRK